MKLNKELKTQLASYIEMLKQDIILTASIDKSDDSQKLRSFLNDVVSVSSKVSLNEITLERTPSFRIDTKDKIGNISFAGVPLGHEFA